MPDTVLSALCMNSINTYNNPLDWITIPILQMRNLPKKIQAMWGFIAHILTP